MNNQNQPYQQPSYQPPPYKQSNPTYSSDLICSVLQIFFVPCLYGLIPLILTISANNSWKQNRHDAYEKKTKIAKVFLIIGWIFLVVEFGAIIYFFFSLVTSGF